MTAKEAYEKVKSAIGVYPKTACVESISAYSFRMKQGVQIFVLKKTGEVKWEDDLEDDSILDEPWDYVPIE